MSSKLVIGNVNLFPYTGSAAIEGDLTVSGILTAKEHHNIIVSSSISYVSGSHKFGDSADDLHQVTGSMMVTGTLSGTIVSGTFYGDGSNLTGVGGGGGGTPGGANTQVQYNDAGSFTGSANFTFDGTGISVSADADITSSLGKTAIGGAGLADAATVAHVDHNTATNFGFRQRSTGQTEINAKADQSINLKLGSQNKVTLNSSGFVGIGENITPEAMLHVSSSTGEPLFRIDHPEVAHPDPIVYVTGSGKVGIGTITPTAQLHISSSVDADENLLFRVDHGNHTSDNPIMCITGSGLVGVGTATPAAAIHIKDDGAAFLVQSEGASDWFKVQSGAITFNSAGGQTYAGGVNLGQRFNIVDAFGSMGVLGLGQYPGSAKNVMEVNSNHSDNGGDWFVIDQSGSVGIGVTDPLALLHISGSDGTDAFRIDTQGATDNPAIFVSGSNSYVGIGTDEPSQGLHVKDNGGGQIVSRIEGTTGRAVLQVDNGANYTFFGASTAGLDFSVGGAGDYGAQQMVLKTTGRLGINVTDPDSQLEVSSSTTQQKWSYDADSYVTMTVADDSHATIASGESGDITIDAATLYVTGSTQHLGGVNGREVGLGTFSGGGTVDWDASLGEYAFVKVSGSAAIDIKIINMEESMTLKLLVRNNGLDAGYHAITLSGTTTSTGTNGTSMTYANGAPSLMIADTDSHVSSMMATFSDGLFELGNNFYS